MYIIAVIRRMSKVSSRPNSTYEMAKERNLENFYEDPRWPSCGEESGCGHNKIFKNQLETKSTMSNKDRADF